MLGLLILALGSCGVVARDREPMMLSTSGDTVLLDETTLLQRLGRQTARMEFQDIQELFSKLTGTWEGSFGFNVVAVPEFSENAIGQSPSDVTTQFKILDTETTVGKVDRPAGQDYMETLIFEPLLADARNRGYKGGNGRDIQLYPVGNVSQYIKGLRYSQTIKKLEDDAIGEVLHEETGMLLGWYDENDGGWHLARQGSVPHGVVYLAPGEVESVENLDGIAYEQGQMNILKIGTIGHDIGCGTAYFHVCDGSQNGYCPHIGRRLSEQTEQDEMISASKLVFETSRPGGNIGMIPFVHTQANVSDLSITYWRESISSADGPIDQLQYSQIMNLAFQRRFECRRCDTDPTATVGSNCNFGKNCKAYDGSVSDCDTRPLIKWPHVQVNTLRKTTTWQFHEKINCYEPGHGAVWLFGSDSDKPLSTSGCMQKCTGNVQCQGIVHKVSGDGICYGYAQIQLRQCEASSDYNLWLRKDKPDGNSYKPGWTRYPATNCYSSAGGSDIDGYDPATCGSNGACTLRQCMALCENMPGKCGGVITMTVGSGLLDCWLRTDLRVQSCEYPAKDYTLWVLN